MNGSLTDICAAFESHFATWGLRLPEGALQTRQCGCLCQAGWTIFYTFGAEKGREYLDFYACHRMTNEQIWRIYADGESFLLAAMQEFFVANDPESKSQYLENNDRFQAMAQALQIQTSGQSPR
jgi:hypothetical protein